MPYILGFFYFPVSGLSARWHNTYSFARPYSMAPIWASQISR